MATKINGQEIERKAKLYVDTDGLGRITIPKMFVQAMKLKKGSIIKQTVKLDTLELIIRGNGVCNSG